MVCKWSSGYMMVWWCGVGKFPGLGACRGTVWLKAVFATFRGLDMFVLGPNVLVAGWCMGVASLGSWG